MSKVITNGLVPKSKLFRRNRRAETRNKNAARAKNSIKYSNGYFLDDCKKVGTYKFVTIPEKEKEIYHYEDFFSFVYDKDNRLVRDEKGVPVKEWCGCKYIIDRIEVIPEHIKKVRTTTYIPKTPVLKRYSFSNSAGKYFKNYAARLIRRIDPEKLADTIALNGNSYRKHFDYWWTVD